MSKATDEAIKRLNSSSGANQDGCGLIIGVVIGIFVALIPAWLMGNVAIGWWAHEYSMFVEKGQTTASPLVLAIIFGSVFVGSAIIIAVGALIFAFSDLEIRLKAQTYALLRIAEKTGAETKEVE